MKKGALAAADPFSGAAVLAQVAAAAALPAVAAHAGKPVVAQVPAVGCIYDPLPGPCLTHILLAPVLPVVAQVPAIYRPRMTH